jgi:AIR synthase-related protein
MLRELAGLVREAVGLAQKRDIQVSADRLPWAVGGPWGASRVRLGDDCAAIPDGNGYILFAIEGIAPELVRSSPRAAGYCSVLVNASDIYSMGGRPLAVVDAVFSDTGEAAAALLDGMQRAALHLGIPIVGGHSNLHSPYHALAVSIVGRATSLITSFDARPGDDVLVAVDLRGRMHASNPFWDATEAPSDRMRLDYEVLPRLAEQGLCRAGKDISMGGVLGSLLMLLEMSEVGAVIDLPSIPRPVGMPWSRWLISFPSYGFVLATSPSSTDAAVSAFRERGIACSRVGNIDEGHELTLCDAGERATVWNLATEGLTRNAASRGRTEAEHA